MHLQKRQIAQSTYHGNSVGRLFKPGSIWDKLWKGATALATVFVPVLGAGMAALDKYTPDRSDYLPGGEITPSGGGKGGGRSPFEGSGEIKLNPREFFAGIPSNKNKKIGNTPKVF